MKINKSMLLLVLAGSLFTSCSSDPDEIKEKPAVSETTETTNVDLEVENFIYRGMSDIYLYKDDVTVLAENYFASQNEKNNFLDNFSTPEALFERLKSSSDRFSYLIEDYREMNRMSSGTERTNGMEFGLVTYCSSCSDIFGYVRLVLPNSPASENGVERGMIFTRVDGEKLTTSNYTSLLARDNYSIGLAEIEGSTITELDQTITLTSREVSANPIIVSKVLDIDGTKVGYLYYNSFSQDFDEDLNSAFGDLKNQGATELVLDLRYNGGGSVRTATDLAAMITGQFPDQVFMKEKWNKKYQDYYESRDPESLLNKFNTTTKDGSAIHSLNLNRVFVLTTKTSASASELIINGLDPYIDVIHIGDITTGKFQASVALYDSPNFDEHHANLNSSHYYAIQPLVLKSMNKNNVSDYVNGLTPDISLKEDVRNLGKLGDPTEPLLKLALDEIRGSRSPVPSVKVFPAVGESGMFKPDYQRMYIDEIPDLIK